MKSPSKFILLAGVLAIVCVAGSLTRAATIIKLNLGGVGPDVSMSGGVFSTIDQTSGAVPTGDQLTAIEYTDFLNFIPDVTSSLASFSLDDLNKSGAATQLGSLVVQDFTGGTFSLYDPSDNLLLQGPVGNSTLAGIVGAPGTGSLFSASLTTVTGGSLASLIAPGSVSLSLSMTNVNGGAGFSINDGSLNDFQADASVLISADSSTPEPTSACVVVIAIGLLRRRPARNI